jgi:hypothetical protein
MDKRIVVHFLQVVPRTSAVPEFSTTLLSCFASGATPGERELVVSQDDTRVRLERLEANGDWLEGEVVRVQRDNIPLEALPQGLEPSRAQSQGHSAVFRYHSGLSLLIIEKNTTNMTPSRFLRYLRAFDPTGRYVANPIANEDVWERFGRMRPKRFSVTLAAVTNPAAVEGPVGAILTSGRILHEATNAPTIHISVREGGGAQGMDKQSIRDIISGLLGNDNDGYQVAALSVAAEDEDEDAGEILNFLDDILKEKGDLGLNGLTSEDSFEARIVFLRTCYQRHMEYIEDYYGAQ